MKVGKKPFDIGILSLLILFAVFLFLVSPIHEFPLNDDWSFALQVKNFYETGLLKILDWSATSGVFHILWGWLFVLPFGFSFTILRLSTLALHLVGTISLYKLLRDMGLSVAWSLFSALVLVFNPWIFQLSYSFMTDVPYFSFMILALFFYYKGLFEEKIVFLCLGSIAVSISFLIREMGILLPMSVMIYLLIWDREMLAKRALAILVVPVLTLICFEYWYVLIHGVTKGHIFHRNTMMNNLMSPRIVVQCLERFFSLAFFLGISLLPLSIAVCFSLKGRLNHSSLKRKISLLFFIGLFIWVATGKATKSEFYPIDYLWIVASFLGVMSGVKPPVIPVGWERALFWISVTSTCVLFAWLFLESAKREDWERKNIAFFALLGGVQFCYIHIAPFFFQRYFLPVIPMIILSFSVLIKRNRLSNNPIVLSFLIIPALFSILSTKDSLSWNQAKWNAAQDLVNRGIPAQHIEAGLEWGCWNFYEYSRKNQDEKAKRYFPVPWWLIDLVPVIDPVYKISFSELDGYEVVSRQSYHSPLFRTPQEILLLLKKPPQVLEGFEDPQKDFTTGWNHYLQSNSLQLSRNLNYVSQGINSLKCELKTDSADTYHYGGMRVKTPMNTPGFIFDMWLVNPIDVKRIYVYCYDNSGNLTAKWSRDLAIEPVPGGEINTFYFLSGLSQDGFQFMGGGGGHTDYIDIFIESIKEKNVVFYIDNFRS